MCLCILRMQKSTRFNFKHFSDNIQTARLLKQVPEKPDCSDNQSIMVGFHTVQRIIAS